MEGVVVLFMLAGLVIPLLLIASQRGRRVPVEYPDPEPAPSSALEDWTPPSDDAGPSAPAAPRLGGHPLNCGHCGGVDFEQREAQLNTAMATFFNVDWANRTATCFVCLRCGHIEWFVL